MHSCEWQPWCRHTIESNACAFFLQTVCDSDDCDDHSPIYACRLGLVFVRKLQHDIGWVTRTCVVIAQLSATAVLYTRVRNFNVCYCHNVGLSTQPTAGHRVAFSHFYCFLFNLIQQLCRRRSRCVLVASSLRFAWWACFWSFIKWTVGILCSKWVTPSKSAYKYKWSD